MQTSLIVIVGTAVVVILVLFMALARMFRKVGPNQAVIVYGFRKPRIIKAGAAVIFPVVET